MQTASQRNSLKLVVSTRAMIGASCCLIRSNSCLFVIALMFCYLVPSAVSQTAIYTISGRVVKNAGQPDQNAYLRLVPIIKEFGAGLDLGPDRVDENGRFLLKRQAEFGATQYLYLTEIIPGSRNSNFPLYSPFLGLSSVNRAFVGYPVKFGTEKNIDLGDVKVNFWYGDVNIRVTLRGDKLTSKNWGDLWYTIRDSRGRVAAGAGIEPSFVKEVDLQLSQLLFCLPEGTWTVQLQKFPYGTNDLSRRVIAQSRKFTIKRGKTPETIDVKICCEGCL